MMTRAFNVLLVGYGSIGRRHDDVLSSLGVVSNIDLVTKQNIKNRTCYKDLKAIKGLNQYDYFVIASETNKHSEQLSFLESQVADKIIFCEKPLFDSEYNLSIVKNKVFVGYVLRFHPILQTLQARLENQKVIYANIRCGQYLPTWRPEADYRNSYSAKKSQGGGVLLDLSHEIDYVSWLLGEIVVKNSFQGTVSDLEIDSDDLTMLFGYTKSGAIINLSLDYISKSAYREISLHTNKETYLIDLITNKLSITDKKGIKKNTSLNTLERNHLFEKMHLSILSNTDVACNYQEGLRVMSVISAVQEESNVE